MSADLAARTLRYGSRAARRCAKCGWEHYADLPYEIVVECVTPSGAVLHRELVGRRSLMSEACLEVGRAQSAIVNSTTHRALLVMVDRHE